MVGCAQSEVQLDIGDPHQFRPETEKHLQYSLKPPLTSPRPHAAEGEEDEEEDGSQQHPVGSALLQLFLVTTNRDSLLFPVRGKVKRIIYEISFTLISSVEIMTSTR